MSFPNLGPFPNLSKANESSFSGLTGAPGDNTALAAALDGKADSADITTHTGNTSNPHSVTAAQAGAIPAAEKGANNGVATLDSDGQVPTSQVPPIALNVAVDVADEAARLALTTEQVQPGDVATQLDDDSIWWLRAADPSQAGSWLNITSEVTLPEDSDDIANLSTVTGSTVTDALDELDSGKQAQSDLLDDVSGLTLSSAAGQLVGVSAGETDLELKSASAVRTFLNLIVGTTVQAYHSILAALSGLTLAAGDMIYATGAASFAKVAKGTAGQIWTMNAGATAPEWSNLTVPGYGYLQDVGSASSDVTLTWDTSSPSLASGNIAFNSNTGFEVAASGVYLVNASFTLSYSGASTSGAAAWIEVNGTDAYSENQFLKVGSGDNAYGVIHLTAILNLSADDVVTIFFNATGTTSVQTNADAGFTILQIA